METGSTNIELSSEGLTNSLLGRLIQWGYDVEYSEENDVYRVGEYVEKNDDVAEIIRNG
jgi:hypothetical protein